MLIAERDEKIEMAHIARKGAAPLLAGRLQLGDDQSIIRELGVTID